MAAAIAGHQHMAGEHQAVAGEQAEPERREQHDEPRYIATPISAIAGHECRRRAIHAVIGVAIGNECTSTRASWHARMAASEE
ncbi:hypothetical protein WSS_A27880 [Rhodococcus opacus M213]|uniref:Uncharacterized protein n=1 Tax=Rhodococcus opacus M213 TaxID=1129896 RepID=K8XMK2_RHOOP|nr:hypothetical protein [Rhodococcus opacus]EKT79452.1 hypothetical protein WSS_A27880 [Rhodococcus opacus M213]